MTDRVLPHSVDSERAVLGSVLIKPSVMDALRVELQVDDFFLPAHREIYDALLAVAKRNAPIDSISLADELRVRDMMKRLAGGELYLLDLVNAVPTAENVAHYVELVKRNATLRRLIATCAEIQSRAYGAGAEVDELLGEASDQLTKIATGAVKDIAPAGELVDPMMDEFERRCLLLKDGKSSVTGIRTGITKLDVITAGLQRQQAITIGGDTGAGKTAFAMQVAYEAAGDPDGMAVVFNLEMPREELFERAFVYYAQVNSQAVKTGALDHDAFKRLHGAGSKLRDLPLYLEEDVFTLRGIEARCRRLRAKFPKKTKVLGVLDTIQLADTGANIKENRARAVGMISKGIKQLAKKLNMTFIMVSQINRDGAKKKAKDGSALPPTMHDLKESGDIEQDSDIIILTHNPEETVDGDIDMYLVKHRNGKRAKLRVHWTARHYRLSDPEIDPGPAIDDRRYAD